MLVSGFAGLGYQMVWTQQFSLWLGHESASVLAVICAVFGGLGVGALSLGAVIERSSRPERWYAACEVAIAMWSAALLAAMGPFSQGVFSLIGVEPAPLWQWSVTFTATFLALLPATAAMGATIPAVERIIAIQRPGRSFAAACYSSNTLGAVAGVLASTFWLVPAIGLMRTAFLCIALNLLCAMGALLAFRNQSTTTMAEPRRATLAAARPLTGLAATGLLGIGYEIVAVRVLSQVAEGTVYTYAMLLAVYLVGTALGAAVYQRWLIPFDAGKALGDWLLCLMTIACLCGAVGLWAADDLRSAALQGFGDSVAAAIGTEALLAVAAFALPTMVMGALFSHMITHAHSSGANFGKAFGVNTLGAAIAPPLFGAMLLPLLGAKLCLVLLAGGYLLLTTRSVWLKPLPWTSAAAVALTAYVAPSLAFIDIPTGGHVVSYEEGVMAAVSVVEDAEGVSRLRINNRQQEGSSSTRLVDARQALLPILLHPAPAHVLFLGLGTGVTAASAAEDSTLQVDAVELLPEVLAASAHFTQSVGAHHGRSLHVIVGDARRYVKTSRASYDVIVSDNFHPARSGSGSLYTVEHFKSVRDRLADQGLFCQWLPLHQLDVATLRVIVQSFLAAFPNGRAILASNSLQTPVLGLVGSESPLLLDVASVGRRLARTSYAEPLSDFALDDEMALLGSFVSGTSALKKFAADAPTNTDDRPVVAYMAPRLLYAETSRPQDRLMDVLGQLSVSPGDVVSGSTDPDISRRLAAYWSARSAYLSTGRGIRPDADVRRMLAQAQQPLLSVLRISPEFRPAYDPLFRMALALHGQDAAGAKELLEELMRVAPQRPEAAQALSAPIADAGR